jgi:hypothetical protein
MSHGARKEIYALAEERAKKQMASFTGKKKTTVRPRFTFYLSDIPFNLINKTMKKQPGRPYMQVGVRRRMAEVDNPGKAILAAPVFGFVAAGAGFFFKWFFRRKNILSEMENNK